jgi:hypothetical protein
MNEPRRAEVKELSEAVSTQLLKGATSDHSETLQLVLPEAPMGWQIYEEFNVEYGLEPRKGVSAAAAPDSKVCFFVALSEVRGAVEKASAQRLISGKYTEPTPSALLH